MFQRLSKEACLFLGFDLASHIVSYLTHGFYVFEFICSEMGAIAKCGTKRRAPNQLVVNHVIRAYKID